MGKGYGEEGVMQLTGKTPQVEQVARLMGQEGIQIPGANEARGPSSDPWCSQKFPNIGGDSRSQSVGQPGRDQQQTSWSVHVNPVSCAAAASVHGCAGALQHEKISQSHEVGQVGGTGSQNYNLFTDPLPPGLATLPGGFKSGRWPGSRFLGMWRG